LNPDIVLRCRGELWSVRKPWLFSGKPGRGGRLLVQAEDQPSEVNSDDVESKHWSASSAGCPCTYSLGVQSGDAAGEKRPEERSFLPCVTRDKKEREK